MCIIQIRCNFRILIFSNQIILNGKTEFFNYYLGKPCVDTKTCVLGSVNF